MVKAIALPVLYNCILIEVYLMRTKSLSMAIDFCTRNGHNMAEVTFKSGWYYLPEKRQAIPTSMEKRKAREFEQVSCSFRPCASGKARYFPADERVGRTMKERS